MIGALDDLDVDLSHDFLEGGAKQRALISAIGVELQQERKHAEFPADHWSKIHSTNGLERLNGEVKRRTEVVGIFPNDDAIVRLVGAILLEQNDEWAVQRARYMTLETMAALSDDPIVGLPAMVI